MRSEPIAIPGFSFGASGNGVSRDGDSARSRRLSPGADEWITEECRLCAESVNALARQTVADLPHRHDVPGLGRIRFELSPQLRDVSIHRAGHDERAVAPDLLQELITSGYSPIPSDEGEQKLVRLGCQGAHLAGSFHGPGSEIDEDVVECDLARLIAPSVV